MTNIQAAESQIKEEINLRETFLADVLRGLATEPKCLDSKYFYDAKGDKLFQQIMHSPEYYPTDCELEILSQQTEELIAQFVNNGHGFDLVELGAGDALKSSFLLKKLVEKNINFTYYPIDISENVINNLHQNLPLTIPGLPIHGLNGEYFKMLQRSNELSTRKKVVLFLGSNIGNMFPKVADKFCKTLRENLSPGDMLLIGVDLQKDPDTILAAYNDAQGFTRDFNLNLLERMNRELGADFVIENFKHYPTYDPGTGSCKSFLVSKKEQTVKIEDAEIHFAENECIHMEISQKYRLSEIDHLAKSTGFKPVHYFFDSKKWFVDAIWRVE
ncbi:MAG: L-histidine N(alpha)-methyltransferase [Daejeonella sp.]